MDGHKDKAHKAVTIDGPAGAGKTTMAKALADALPGFAYADTGAFYRLLALAVLEKGFAPDALEDKEALHAASLYLSELEPELEARLEDGAQVMYLAGRKIPDPELRTEDVSKASSVVSTDYYVRAIAGRMIRKYAESQDVVVEGRDAGTALFPDARVKFYLYAGTETRAARRIAQLRAAGDPDGKTSPVEMAARLRERDARDAGRKADPLKIPEDAVYVDTDALDADAVRAVLVSVARHRLDPASVPAL